MSGKWHIDSDVLWRLNCVTIFLYAQYTSRVTRSVSCTGRSKTHLPGSNSKLLSLWNVSHQEATDTEDCDFWSMLAWTVEKQIELFSSSSSYYSPPPPYPILAFSLLAHFFTLLLSMAMIFPSLILLFLFSSHLVILLPTIIFLRTFSLLFFSSSALYFTSFTFPLILLVFGSFTFSYCAFSHSYSLHVLHDILSSSFTNVPICTSQYSV